MEIIPTDETTDQMTTTDAAAPAPTFAETGPMILDAHAFVAAWSAVVLGVSKDTTRPVLCNVHMECSTDGYGVELVATDSYRLHRAAITTREPMPAEWRGRNLDLVPLHLAGLKALLKRETLVTITYHDGPRPTYTVAALEGSMTGDVYTGCEYVNWRRLFADNASLHNIAPDIGTGVLFALNPAFLEGAAKAARAFIAGDDGLSMRMVAVSTPSRPVCWQVKRQDVGTLDVLIMPVRVS